MAVSEGGEAELSRALTVAAEAEVEAAEAKVTVARGGGPAVGARGGGGDGEEMEMEGEVGVHGGGHGGEVEASARRAASRPPDLPAIDASSLAARHRIFPPPTPTGAMGVTPPANAMAGGGKR
uniref:Uncharacterized protein n=1 Tax=Oryza sativa subsp. japonica TaxID=39947 RepID=Q69Q35_ORYSJ|nr:hypothetical protein [Oryza sativa Japonica Group]BAD36118.1 hypothetical protein [Oryza sativa Japonica Group]